MPDEAPTLDETVEQMIARRRQESMVLAAAAEALTNQRATAYADTAAAFVAASRTPISEAAATADQLIRAIDEVIRKKWGTLPWVARSRMGTVQTVQAAAHTCTARTVDDTSPTLPGNVVPQRTIHTGIGVPTVGKDYLVEFPVRLPDPPAMLLRGPVPFGAPWLKAPAGATWIYYMGYDFGANRFGLYRVTLPPMDDLAFTYDPATVLHLGNFGTFAEGDTEPQWAGATYHRNLLWADSHRWESFAYPEDAPTFPPWPTRLHRYQELGTFGPPSETSAVISPLPHVKLFGSNLSADAPDDYLVGIARYSLQVPEIPTRPDLTLAQRGRDQMFDLVVGTGGSAWAVVRSGFRQFKNIWLFFTAGGYYQQQVHWVNSTVLDATEWTADSPTAWGLTGERISVFALAERTDEPYPGDARLNGPDDRARALFAGYGSHNPYSVHLYVSRAAGSAVLALLPTPPGWVEGFALRSLGGARLRGWWYGHETQVQDPVTAVVTQTPSHLWWGEGNQDGSDWTWQMREPVVGPGTIVTVSNDATTIITRVLTDPAHFVSTYYISEDAGLHWRGLPAPPYWADSYSAHQLWLVDTA